ncbi:MAG: UbiH/UbiF/VisC/COQ6 family ubiquinone biosynthesis hydroxylase [Rhodopila sp.]
MPDPISVQVAIMGAGPVGGTLACRLANAGITVAVIDKAALPPMEHPEFDGRAYAIAAGSRTLLEHAGLWDILPVPPNPIRDIRVSDGRVGRPASRLHLHFDHREAGDDAAAFGWMIEARSLRVALNIALPRHPAVHVFAPAEARVDRNFDRVEVHLADNSKIHAELIVAAEGRQSPLREQARIPLTRIPYGQSGIVCAIAHEKPHHNLALEHFLPAGPFAALPMGPSEDAIPGGAPNVSAIVWTEADARAETIMALDEVRFTREIKRRLGNHLGTIMPIGRRWTYKLSAMLAHRYTDERLVLAGDAAHGIHPIAGQGLNLGFRDAIALADLIIMADRAGQDVGGENVLRQYQRLRQCDNLLMLTLTDQLDRLFSNDNRLVRTVRDIGIAAVDRTTPLKRMFMRRAMGL